MSDNEDWRTAWQFNVVDEYKGLTVEEIRAELKKKALTFGVCMSNLQGDFNFSTLVRNCNAFGVEEVFYFGKKKWDRRGAQGTYKYTDVTYLDSIEQLKALQDRYTLIGIENVEGSVSLHDFIWPVKPLMIFGEEACGLSEEVLSLCSFVVEIPQRGSVRSINVGCASSVVMYDYAAKLKVNT